MGRIDEKEKAAAEAARKKQVRKVAQNRTNKLDTAERKRLAAGAKHRRKARILTVKRRSDRATIRSKTGKPIKRKKG